MSSKVEEVEVAGRCVRLTNLDKVLWPETGTTKGELLDYYARITPVLLPHVEGRPLTLARFPDGVDGKGWFQTTCPHPPAWMSTYPVRAPDGSRLSRDYCLADEPAAIVWLVNLAAIELHPLLGCAPRVDEPTVLLFDLDPGEAACLVDCCRVALVLRDALASVGLHALPKTSGWAGLHVVVPLNTPHTYAHTKRFARLVARELAHSHAQTVVDSAPVARRGRVLIDWAQNSEHRSIVAPYSLRAIAWPSVSTPLRWEEVERTATTGDPSPLLVDKDGVLTRLDRHGDLFTPVLEEEQHLPGAGL